MKLFIPKKQLREALSGMSKIISGKVVPPILGAVRIERSENGVTVRGTNLEESLTWIIRGAKGGGSFITGMKDLSEYLRKGGGDGTVQFESAGDKIAAVFHAGNIPCVKQFSSFPLDEWPEFPRMSGRRVGVANRVFANIRKAAPSASSDVSRRVLNSVMIEPGAIVATNGRELLKLRCDTGVSERVVIPVSKFIKSAKFANGVACAISVRDIDGIRYCAFTSEEWMYATKCVSGNYPDYTRVIPKSRNGTLEFSRNDVEHLKKGIPLLECDKAFNTVHLYADGKRSLVMPEDMKGAGLMLEAKYKGLGTVAVSLDGHLLSRSLDLGFTKLCFQSDGFSPVLAENGEDKYVFMPLRGVSSERIKKAVMEKEGASGIENGARRDQPRRGYRPTTSIPGTVIETINNKQREVVAIPLAKEDEKMMKAPRNEKQGFQVVGDVGADPFEKLLLDVAEMRGKIREALEVVANLSKEVKDAQRAAKAKERDFKSARDLLGKLKKVSGF